MKTFTKFLLTAGLVTLGSRAASAQVLYDNFENTRIVTYTNVSGALAPIANPGGGTVNTSATCGKYDRDASQYAIIDITPTAAPMRMADVSAYSAGTKKLSMKFRSPAPGTQKQAGAGRSVGEVRRGLSGAVIAAAMPLKADSLCSPRVLPFLIQNDIGASDSVQVQNPRS